MRLGFNRAAAFGLKDEASQDIPPNLHILIQRAVEGAIGGVAGAAVLGLLYGLFLGEEAGAYTAISAAGALISMIGDLSASAIKRNAGIKDYGTLIPGHGGVLDRFDSVIFTAPVIYFMAQCLPL